MVIPFRLFPWLTLLFVLLPGAVRAQEGGAVSNRALERERRAGLVRLLEERNIAFEERSLFAEYGGFGTSVHIRFPAAEEGASRSFILALPLSKRGDPGTPLPFGFEAALGFIEKMGEQPYDGEWGVVFLGDEYRELPPEDEDGSPLGLLDLYDRLDDPEHTYLVYLDLFEPPGGIRIHHGISGDLSPLGLTAPFTAACDARGIPYDFAYSYNGLYRLGLARGPELLDFALTRGMPAIMLSAGPAGGTRPLDPEAAAELLAAYARSARIPGEQPDTRYTLFYYLGRAFYLPETATVVLLCLGTLFLNAVVLIYSLAYRPRFTLRRKLVFPYMGMLVLHFFALYGALYGVELCFSFLLGRLSVDPRRPFYWGPALLILTGITLYFLVSLPFTRIKKNRRRARLYGNGALVWFFLALLAGTALDITLVPIFIWALLMGIAGAFIKVPQLVFLAALLVFPRIPGAFLSLRGTGTAALSMLISSGNPLLPIPAAISLFPLLLLFMRSLCLFRRGKKPLPWKRALILRLCFFAASAGALVFYGYNLAKLPPGEPVRRTLEEGPGEEGILRPEVRERVAFERRIVDITLAAEGSPLRFDLFLEPGEGNPPPVIYGAAMPFSYGRDGSSLRFTLGEGPPNPFNTEIVLSPDFSGVLRVEAWYMRGEEAAEGPVPPAEEGYDILRVIKTLPIASSGSP
jgi:hypothetical protein